MVYDNNTILVAHFEGRKSQASQSMQTMTIIVTVQSCSDQGICLPPSTLKEAVHMET
jgi:thiol:disulfide interchange protein